MESVPKAIEPNVKLKIGTIISQSFTESLDKLKRVNTFSGEMSFKIRRIGKRIKEATNDYNDLRLQTLTELAKKNEDGSPMITYGKNGEELYTLLPENRPAFQKRVKELQSAEIEIEKIKFSDLGDSHGLSPHDLLELEFIEE